MSTLASSEQTAWYRTLGPDQAQLLDWRSGQPFGVRTELVDADPGLRAGLDYLAERGGQITVESWGVRHETANDLGPFPGSMGAVPGETFEEKVAAADYFSFEYFGGQTKLFTLALEAARAAIHEVSNDWWSFSPAFAKHLAGRGLTNGSSYLERLVRAIALAEESTVAICTDVQQDASTGDNEVIGLLEHAGSMAEEAPRAFTVAAAQLGRERISVARLGSELLRHEGERIRPIKVFDLWGGEHGGRRDQLAALNVDVRPSPDYQSGYNLREITRTNIVPPSSVSELGALGLWLVEVFQQQKRPLPKS